MKEEPYTAEDAYKLVRDSNSILRMKLKQKSKDEMAFSHAGRTELITMLKILKGTAIITVPLYSFVAKESEKVFLVDTDYVTEDLRGNGNAILKVFLSPDSAAKWIWKRLHRSDLKYGHEDIVFVSLMGCPTNETRKQEDKLNVTESIDADSAAHVDVTCVSDQSNSPCRTLGQETQSPDNFPSRDRDGEPMECSAASSDEDGLPPFLHPLPCKRGFLPFEIVMPSQ